MVRQAAVAGQWYPGRRLELEREVDGHLAAAAGPSLPPPRAIVVPHAGLRYSGPVAAHVYRLLAEARYRAIVLVGPSHFMGFAGVALWPDGAWQSPLGDQPIDASLAAAIRDAARQAERQSSSRIVFDNTAPHLREHSLEMQLPFVSRLCPGTPIVPLVMGYQTRETAEALGDVLAQAVGVAEGEARAGGPATVLLVASTDLSHYHDAITAGRMDAVVVRCVEALDPDALMTALEREPHHACGGGPLVAVLRAARQLGATHARVLNYADSGDVSGDKQSVVGYMAATLW